jgi:hypothetical protein
MVSGTAGSNELPMIAEGLSQVYACRDHVVLRDTGVLWDAYSPLHLGHTDKRCDVGEYYRNSAGAFWGAPNSGKQASGGSLAIGMKINHGGTEITEKT